MLPLEPLLEPELLGELGEVLLLPELPLPLEPEVLPELLEPELPLEPEVPPAAPELDLKWASHSEREIEPSLLLSTDEKVGAEVLAPLALLPDMPLPVDDEPPLDDEPPAAEPLAPEEPLEPEADGVEVDGLLLEPPLEPDEELCATATLEIASSAAAVAALRTLRLSIG